MSSSLKSWPRWVKGSLILLGILFLGGFFFLRILPWLVPYSGQAVLDSLQFSPVVLDAEGQEIQVLPLENGLRRVYAARNQLPPYLEDILLRSEDQRFFWHPGVDLAALLRAVFQNMEAGTQVSGASTITMQLARILQPRPRTLENKLGEAWEALQLEARLSKEEILLYYVNLLPFGFNTEGFATAARVFYGKDLKDLSPWQIKVLTVIPRSPQKYNPFNNPEENLRAVLLLAQGLGEELGKAQARDSEPASGKEVLDPSRSGIWPFRAPHFVQFLTTRPEWKAHDFRRPFQTTLEPQTQNALERHLLETVQSVQTRGGRISNGAGLFVRPETMTVAAYVGSVDFFNKEFQGQIDGVQIQRQPGSTLKPFLYALAMTKGWTAATVLPDIPTDFGGEEIYTPSNYNQQFNGPIRLRQALASSLNIPAVYTLNRLGVIPFADFLLSLGISSLEGQRSQLGLGLSLGNVEIRLFELVRAYGVFLNHGRPVNLVFRKEDRRTEDETLTTSPPLDPRIAALIRDILVRHPDRTLVFGRGGATRLKFEGAIKTGTSNQFNNIWALGFTNGLLGGIWMGNFDGTTVISSPGAGLPAGVLSRMLEEFGALDPFPPVQGLERHTICSLSGQLATPHCTHSLSEWFLPGTAPEPCTWHRLGAEGPQYPQEYSHWLQLYRYRQPQEFEGQTLSIIRPRPQALFYWDPSLPASAQGLQIEALGHGTGRIAIDGVFLREAPFPLKHWWPLKKGKHTLTISDEFESKTLDFEVR